MLARLFKQVIYVNNLNCNICREFKSYWQVITTDVYKEYMSNPQFA